MKISTLKPFSSFRLVVAVSLLWIVSEAVLCSADICGPEEEWCTLLDDNEKVAYEAIGSLHRQLDDNNDGSINLDESDDFLREELKYEKDYEKRQKVFHSNNDQQVSIRELWETWVKSEVHNWTVEQTIEWLGTFVGLPQYEVIFTKNSINGTFLPRLAVNHQQFLTSNLGVKDLIHKQKIALKAQDVVLFGPPKDYGNRTKDLILTSLLGLAIISCWFVFRRYKSSQRDLNKMIKDMESLAKAERELQDLQKEMEKTKAEMQTKVEESPSHRPSIDTGIHASASDELLNLRGEVEVLRSELQRAELELQDKCWVPPPALQHWLQLTYELELKSYNKKKQAAEKQLRQAKDACDKLKKKRSSLMGAFVSTHGRSIDDVDKAISEARASLTDVTQELQERMHRWKQIEMLVNCPIMNNAGLPHLESILRSYGKLHFGGLGSVMSNSQDDIDDDGASSIYCPSAVSVPATRSYQSAPIIRSKSVNNMSSARTNSSNESPTKDFSNLEDEFAGEPFEMRALPKDRRVTFGIQDSDKGISNGKKDGENTVLKSNGEAGECNGLNGVPSSTVKSTETDETSSFVNGLATEGESRKSSTTNGNGNTSKNEPDVIKIPANQQKSTPEMQLSNSENTAKAETTSNHSLSFSNKSLPAVPLRSTNGDTSINEKKPNVWKRFSSFVSKNNVEKNNLWRSSSKNRHKVYTSEQINNTSGTAAPPSFIKNDLSPATEKN